MDNDKILQQFNTEINGFFTSRLILVDKVINKYLRYVAATPKILEIVAESAKINSYETLYNKAMKYESSGSRFVLPDNRKQIITLVTGLLFDFDNKNLSIIDFITKFYPSETVRESYVDFCEKLITPYAEAIRYYCADVPQELNCLDEEDEKPVAFPDKAKEELHFWIAEITNLVIGDNTLPEAQRKEFMIELNGMRYASETGNAVLMNIVWVGLKNTLGDYKAAFRELKEVGTILLNYGVTDVQ